MVLEGPDAGQEALPPLAQVSLARALGYSASGEWLYWADAEQGGLWRATRAGTNR